MNAVTEFMRAAQTLPTPVLSLLAKGVERMQNATAAEAVAQNHAYLVGIINASVGFGKLSTTAADDFCSGAMQLCRELIADLGVVPIVVNPARYSTRAARRTH